MIISPKDVLKLLGISIVCFCAVFVCTFFLNYYIDVLPLKDAVPQEILPLYDAQIATAKLTCAITGGFLSVIAIIMLVFYLKLYIDNHRTTIGIFKAMGYSDIAIAKNFTLFGLSVLLGCGLGFAVGWICMPYIYKTLTIEGLPAVTASFHVNLLICLVPAPTMLFTAIAFAYAFAALRKPALSLMKDQTPTPKNPRTPSENKDLPFLKEMRIVTLKSKKLLVFFVTFSCFCFSAMVQMGLSMEDLMSGTMGVLILAIGLVLAVVSIFMSMTSLVKNNAKNIAVMKAMGFSQKECFSAIFVGYIPFAILGFAVGTVYQYGLLSVMINIVFKNVANVPSYDFNVPVFFITLALFSICYTLVFAVYLRKVNKISVRHAYPISSI